VAFTTRNMKAQYQSAPRRLFFRAPVQILPALAMSSLALTLISVLAGALGVWRFGADLHLTNRFFLTSGLLSRYQLWFAIAIGAQTSAFILNWWVANRKLDVPALAGTTTDSSADREHRRRIDHLRSFDRLSLPAKTRGSF